MKQKLLADIELDVHELKYLMDSFTKEPTQTLSELLKRSVARMQGRLDELSQEIDSVELVSLSSFVVEETVVKENEITAQEKDASVIIQSPKPVIEAAEEEKEERMEWRTSFMYINTLEFIFLYILSVFY